MTPALEPARAMRRLLVIGVLVVSVTLLLTLLFVRAESVSPQAHYDYTKTLRDLRAADAETNGEVLANRLEITRNYDALTFYFDRAMQAAEAAANVPAFLSDDERANTSEMARKLYLALEEKARLIEAFKRGNAVLRNSLAYFPVAADGFLGGNISASLKGAAEEYVRHVLNGTYLTLNRMK